MVAWTSPEQVVAALGVGAAPPVDDAYLAAVVDAANAAAFRKRREAGYVDDAGDNDAAPSPDVALGATTWAVALWRERQSTDSFQSFEDLSSFAVTSGSWSSIRRLLAIGRARVDYPSDPAALEYLNRRRARRIARARRL